MLCGIGIFVEEIDNAGYKQSEEESIFFEYNQVKSISEAYFKLKTT